VFRGELVRALHSFLRFDGKFVPTDGHGYSPASFVILSEAKNLCNALAAAKCQQVLLCAQDDNATRFQNKTGSGHLGRLPQELVTDH
jgi:hypothetical protein